jgi:molecular chaperone GrpE
MNEVQEFPQTEKPVADLVSESVEPVSVDTNNSNSSTHNENGDQAIGSNGHDHNQAASDKTDSTAAEDETPSLADETLEAAPVTEKNNETTTGEDWKERYIRLASEFDNFKKRTNKEKEQLIRFGNEQLLKAFLPLLDDLERAVRIAEQAQAQPALVEGLQMAQKNLLKSLERQGVTPFDSVGKPFDADLHEAIMSRRVENANEKGIVLEELERGFKYYDKVIRFAKVITGE